jgi:hypothetical protein
MADNYAPRTAWIPVRVNEAEKMAFTQAARRAGKRGPGPWLRDNGHRALSGSITSDAGPSFTEAERSELKELERQLARIGGLLNQEVHRMHIVHETGQGTRPTAEEVTALHEQLAELAAKIRDLLGEVSRRRIRAKKAARATTGEQAAAP